MKKRLLILSFIHTIVVGMDNEQSQRPALNLPEPKANHALMRAITESNHAAMLSALRNNQDQNYLWPQNTDDQYKEYVDLTAAMYGIKMLRHYNRRQLVWNVGTALAWDLGNVAMKYALGSYAAQYPILNHVEPIRQSHTARLLFGSGVQERPIVNTYNPAKRIARDLLIKENTNLTLECVKRWEGNPVTVETHLNSMLHSWNPVTRKDGQDLSTELGQVLRTRQGINQNDEGFMMPEGHGLSMMGFTGTQHRARRIILFDNDY